MYISLPSLYDYNVRRLNLAFCGGGEHKAGAHLRYRHCSPFQFHTRIIRHHWTNWTRWNKIVEVWNNASSLLKWRFRRPSRHGCLSSKSTKCFVIQMITNEYTVRLLTSQVRPWINVIHETYSKSRSNSPLEKRGRNWAELIFTKTSGNVTGHVPVSYLLIVFPSDFLRSLCKT